MDVKELYAQIGDYDEVFARLRSEELVAKFAVRFLDDLSCPNLVAAWKAHDDRAAFDAAHTAKGVCGNLAMTELARLASEATEALRPGNEDLRAETDLDALISEFDAEFQRVNTAIVAFRAHREG